jgi:hypothetical protein
MLKHNLRDGFIERENVMSNKYGPWATSIDVGMNPQLSAFWKRRMRMLVPASQTSPMLSRGNLLWLGLALVLITSLPTLFFTSASAGEKKTDDETQSLIKTGAGVLDMTNPPAETQTKEPDSEGGASDISSPSGRHEWVSLPAYSALGDTKLWEKLGLSPEQVKTLREISADYEFQIEQIMSESEDFYKELAKMRSDEKTAKQAEFKQKVDELKMIARTRIEEVITAKQMENFKNRLFPGWVPLMIQDSDVKKIIKFTTEQNEKFKKLRKEHSQQSQQEKQEKTKQALKMLSPGQLEKLKIEVERQYFHNLEPDLNNIGGGSLTVNAGNAEDFWWSRSGIENNKDFISLPIYENLGDPEFRHTIGLSENQEKQLKEITANARSDMLKISEELKKPVIFLEFERESVRVTKDVHKKIDALLTPEHLAALKDNLFHNRAFDRLKEPDFQKIIGLNDQQKADINRLNMEWNEKYQNNNREEFKKELDLLNPEQQEKLRAELDRRGW